MRLVCFSYSAPGFFFNSSSPEFVIMNVYIDINSVESRGLYLLLFSKRFVIHER